MSDEQAPLDESADFVPQDRAPDFIRLLSHQQCEEAIRDYVVKNAIVPVGNFATRMLWEIHHETEMVIRLELFYLGEPPT